MDLSQLRERRDFGTFTVSELNNYIKTVIANDRTLASVTVKGEISNLVNHRSGHLYFSVKDAEGQIRAVMFRSNALRMKFVPESGMKVILTGSVSVYTRDGSYQLYVNSIQPDGIGALYMAYEQLRDKLSAEGLFDESNKRPIPPFPSRIGVITSPTGAAVRDIINVTGRRFPLADVYLYPSLVQGDGAEENLIRALDYFDRSGLVDVVIIGRGGGSIEDLWAFNGERLARRIFLATVPIISAVGHETDFTICDFVADLRAPTPSAAAEIAVPDIKELFIRLDAYSDRAERALYSALDRSRQALLRLSDLAAAYSGTAIINKKRGELLGLSNRAKSATNAILKGEQSKMLALVEKTNAMNPLSVLSRGYSVVESNTGVIKTCSDVSVGDDIRIKISDGTLIGTVSEILRS